MNQFLTIIRYLRSVFKYASFDTSHDYIFDFTKGYPKLKSRKFEQKKKKKNSFEIIWTSAIKFKPKLNYEKNRRALLDILERLWTLIGQVTIKRHITDKNGEL